jgi:tetratricopeptide (TPR) repeat protein
LSLAAYLELFTGQRARLLARGRPLAYEGNVDATVMLTVGGLPPAAVQLLQVCALLAPDALPIDQFLEHADPLGDPLASTAREPIDRAELLGALRRTSLLAADPDGTSRIHRLAQAVLLAHLPDPNCTLLDRTIRLLDGLWPAAPKQPAAWPACARLLPHLDAIRGHARQQQLATLILADLLTRAGHYIWARGLGASVAYDMDKQALTTYQQLYGEDVDHCHIATSLLSLASDLRGLGEHQHARDRDEQAVAMYQRIYGQDADHPKIAQGLNNLGTDLRALNEPQRARDLHEQALAMRQRLYVEHDHLDNAQSLNNLGIDLHNAGDDQRARDLHEQALAMRQRLYGKSDHPQIAQSLNNLAIDMRALAEHARARELDEQALAMRQRLYGEQTAHLDIATSLNNLASDLRALGEHARARELDEQASAMHARLATQDASARGRTLAD